MKKCNKFISALLAATMCLSCVPITPVFAEEYTTPVVATVEAANFSVTVPTGLPVYMDASGVVSTDDDVSIINNSHGAVQVVDLGVYADDEWSIVSFEEDLQNAKVDSKQISLDINGCQTTGEDAISFDDSKFSIMKAANDSDATDECAIVYDANLTPSSEGFTDDVAAHVVFTIDWCRESSDSEQSSWLAYEKPYVAKVAGEDAYIEYSYIFHENGTYDYYIDGVIQSTASSEENKEAKTVTIIAYDASENIVATVSEDGTYIVMATDDGLSIGVILESDNPSVKFYEDGYWYSNPDQEGTYIAFGKDGTMHAFENSELGMSIPNAAAYGDTVINYMMGVILSVDSEGNISIPGMTGMSGSTLIPEKMPNDWLVYGEPYSMSVIDDEEEKVYIHSYVFNENGTYDYYINDILQDTVAFTENKENRTITIKYHVNDGADTLIATVSEDSTYIVIAAEDGLEMGFALESEIAPLNIMKTDMAILCLRKME